MKKKRDTIKNAEVDAEVRKNIGQKIKQKRNQLKHSAAYIAELLGISREAITHIETGRNNINAVSLWKLATLFSCDINDFFPTIPEGYSLTKSDLDKLKREDENVAEWAEKLFKKKS